MPTFLHYTQSFLAGAGIATFIDIWRKNQQIEEVNRQLIEMRKVQQAKIDNGQ